MGGMQLLQFCATFPNKTFSAIPIACSASHSAIEFVGPICESTCKFGSYKNYQKMSENDFVAITNVGAYGSSLSSNYNSRPLIAELLVNKNKIKYIS